MTFSPASLKPYLPSLAEVSPAATWWVGLSGGLDSCVLLHALRALQLPVRLQALHINHQISVNADTWQAQCADFCAHLQVAFCAVKVSVKNSGRGLEDAAREARYRVFEEAIKPGDILFTAHHADDQSETLLLRLLRGTGPRGLAAMARVRPLAEGFLYRPLLDFSRAELETYARAQGLSWVDDESNADDHYDRNYLRNQVLPLLRERWPAFAGKWQQTAELCASNEALIEELALQDLQLADFQAAFIGTSISLTYLQSLSPVRRHNLLRLWLREQKLATPEQAHLQQIERQVIAGRQDAEVQVGWGDVSLRVYRQRVFALPVAELPVAESAGLAVSIEQPQGSIGLANGLQLKFEWCEAGVGHLLRPNLDHLHIRFRQGGERCRPAGRAHSQTLKRLLQDCGLEPWLRDSLPLLYSGEQLVAVADLWVCEGYAVREGGYSLKYERKPNP
ncbi:MAG TPA: tRNA lysidine(34) synthetase TilS [Cellvibrio sp.]|nr:tRNA lysidine(34) synthetase TilS [Cellvibrio sp.]